MLLTNRVDRDQKCFYTALWVFSIMNKLKDGLFREGGRSSIFPGTSLLTVSSKCHADADLQCYDLISTFERHRRKYPIYNLNVMRQSACLIMVDNYAAFFNCTPMGQASDSMIAPT